MRPWKHPPRATRRRIPDSSSGFYRAWSSVLRLLVLTLLPAFFLPTTPAFAVQAQSRPLVIGLDADMSGGSAQAGEAIRRGAVLAVEEINAKGGVLGRPLTLEVRDHRGNPARGVANMKAFAANPDLLAVIGGLHTPVALEELDIVHQENIVFLVPWAAGTDIVSNGRDPNFVFRVSVRDEHAGAFLVEQALRAGFERPGLLLEQTGWGRSNEQAMQRALADHGRPPADVQWFHWGTQDTSLQLDRLILAGADVILLVANAPEGAVAVRSMLSRPGSEQRPFLSHWGITGGDFCSRVGPDLFQIQLYVLQTFSFAQPSRTDKARQVLDRYQKRFGPLAGPDHVPAAPGTAHAYDLVHLLALAAEQAGTPDRAAIRDALENLGIYKGLVRTYDPPFTPRRHDALTSRDFRISCFGPGETLAPCDMPPRAPR